MRIKLVVYAMWPSCSVWACACCGQHITFCGTSVYPILISHILVADSNATLLPLYLSV
jgi:hypothetical protein